MHKYIVKLIWEFIRLPIESEYSYACDDDPNTTNDDYDLFDEGIIVDKLCEISNRYKIKITLINDRSYKQIEPDTRDLLEAFNNSNYSVLIESNESIDTIRQILSDNIKLYTDSEAIDIPVENKYGNEFYVDGLYTFTLNILLNSLEEYNT